MFTHAHLHVVLEGIRDHAMLLDHALACSIVAVHAIVESVSSLLLALAHHRCDQRVGQ